MVGVESSDTFASCSVLLAHTGPKKRNGMHVAASDGQLGVLKTLCEHIWATVPDSSGTVRGTQPTGTVFSRTVLKSVLLHPPRQPTRSNTAQRSAVLPLFRP